MIDEDDVLPAWVRFCPGQGTVEGSGRVGVAAYTVSRVYDDLLRQGAKVVERGYVWRTADEAQKAAAAAGEGYAAYFVLLPGPWSECVIEHADGTASLLVDAEVIRRITW